MLLTSRQEQIILGTLLGDSDLRMTTVRSRNALFRNGHCDKDREYVFWKYKELETTGLFRHIPKLTVRQFKDRTGFRTRWWFRSRSHSVFTELHKLFYPNGKKIVPPEVLEKLGDLGLAVWYMDDGSLSLGRPGRPMVSLCTEGFSLEENCLVRDWFKSKYGLSFKFIERSLGAYRLRLSRRYEVYEFVDIVRPYIVPCMERKINFRK